MKIFGQSKGNLAKTIATLKAAGTVAAVFACASVLAAPPEAVESLDAVARPGTVVRVGLLDFESEASYLGRRENIQRTVLEHLQKTVPGIRIEARWYKTAGLAAAVRNHDVEFFLGSSGFFVEMSRYGARDIGTIVSRSFPDPNQCVAGVIFVRKDRKDLKNLDSLKGKVAVSTDPRNFMTYQIGLGEIARAGYDPDNFFSKIRFTNSQPVAVMQEVLDGKAEVGILRACMPESIASRFEKFQGVFRVINERVGPRADRLGCRYSTEMYPGWTFAVNSHTPAILTREIAISLLSMRPEETPSGFEVSFATNYAKVNQLFETLKVGPYAYLREWTVRRFLEKAWPFLLFAAGLAGAWILHSLRLEKLVRKRTEALVRVMNREREAEAHAREAGEKLDQLQRVSMVGQLSSIFAHDLAQPLSAMRYYVHTLRKLEEKRKRVQRGGDADAPARPSVEETCLTGLQTQISNAGAILERVRSYAKAGGRRDQAVDLPKLAADALSELERSKRLNRRVDASYPKDGEGFVWGDPVELRVLIVNLIKNAQEAMEDLPSELAIKLTVVPTAENMSEKRAESREDAGARVTLVVENPGDLLSQSTVAKMGQVQGSSKKTGLGLGLMICRSIAEAHRATLCFEARSAEEAGGLRVRFDIAAAKPQAEKAEDRIEE